MNNKSNRGTFKLLSFENIRQSYLLKSSLKVSMVVLVTKAIQVLKELVVASSFGRSDAIEIYILAFLVPSSIAGLLNSGISPALVPLILSHPKDERRNISEFSSIVLLSTIAILAILLSFKDQIFHLIVPDNYQGRIGEIAYLFLWLFLFTLFQVISGLFSAILQARNRVMSINFTHSFCSLLTVIIVLVAPSPTPQALAIGVIVGSIIQAVWLGVQLYQEKLLLLPTYNIPIKKLASLLKTFCTLILSGSMAIVSEIVDVSMASSFGQGSISALNYGSRITSLILGILGTAVGSVIFQHFSNFRNDKSWHRIAHSTHKQIQFLLLVLIPLSVLSLMIANPLITTIFERGAFSSADTKIVAQIHQLYSMQIPFIMLEMICFRLFAVLGRSYLIFFITLFNMIFNIFGNYLFMQFIGVHGIALSTSLTHFVASIICLIILKRTFKTEIFATKLF